MQRTKQIKSLTKKLKANLLGGDFCQPCPLLPLLAFSIYKETLMQRRKKEELSLSTIVIRFVVSFAAIYFFWKLLLLAGR